MGSKPKATRKCNSSLLYPDDPRWDIRIGIPRPHLMELLVTEKRDAGKAVRLTGKGGAF